MLTLYRADKKGNKTLPEKYATEGLFTKQLNSGDHPAPQEKYGWLKTIKSHIKYTNAEEEFIYDTTQYLSFTTDKERLLFYLSTDKNLKCIKANRFNADCFLFTAQIEQSKMELLGNGVYLFTFNCNYNKTKNDPNFQTLLSGYIACNICSTYKNYEHCLIIIDVKNYLFNLKDIYPQEYANADKDSEWLLMPADPMIGSNAKGFQSRIHIADFWTVDFYKYE